MLQVLQLCPLHRKASLAAVIPTSHEPPLVPCCRSLDQCRFRGSLPAEWGMRGAFQELSNLTLSYNSLSSTIPASWTYASSFPKLQQLDLTGTQVCGGVPAGLPVDTVCQGDTNACVARPCDPAVLASPPPPPPGSGGGNGEVALLHVVDVVAVSAEGNSRPALRPPIALMHQGYRVCGSRSSTCLLQAPPPPPPPPHPMWEPLSAVWLAVWVSIPPGAGANSCLCRLI